jgi:cation diffusion facilitator CzcD-associated flavoprotein CzcO
MGSLEIEQPEYDVIIIGAGLSGCYASYRMQQLQLKQKVLETGTSVGGTWYWNRYPGARFDCESYTYGFSWSKELLEEWDWTEEFAPQAETERYVRFICDRFSLWQNMQFNTTVASAHWDDDSTLWRLTDQDGQKYTSRFLITGIGLLSAPTLPNIRGVESFAGDAFHTSRWPKDQITFEGKRVGIIGVGATAIQIIPEIAKTAAKLTVFQRTPNWAIPLHNSPIDKAAMAKIRKGYPELFEKINRTRLSFMHDGNPASIWDATPEEREVLWEYLYAQPGFGFWVSNYKEILIDRKANALVSDFVAKKIRQRVKDPWTAEKLIPKTHGSYQVAIAPTSLT